MRYRLAGLSSLGFDVANAEEAERLGGEDGIVGGWG